jgi:hypothetical protein
MSEYDRGYEPSYDLNTDVPEHILAEYDQHVQEGYDGLTLTFDLADDRIQPTRKISGPTNIPGKGTSKIDDSYGA